MSGVPSWLEMPAGLDAAGAAMALTMGLLAIALLNAGIAVFFRLRSDARRRQVLGLQKRWHPAIVEYLFADRPAADVHALVAPRDRMLFVGSLLEFVRRTHGEERARVRILAQPYLQSVARRLGRRSPGVRARAVQTLGDLGWRDYAPSIVAALDDPSPLVSIVAARVLCRRETADHVPDVLLRIGRFSSWTAEFLSSMLAACGPTAAHALRETLWDDDQDDEARAIAAVALRRLGDLRADRAAAHVLAEGAGRELTIASIRLLGEVGRHHHLDLIRGFLQDSDFVIRVATVDALATLGGQPELEQLHGLVHADPSRWVALHAARGLAHSGQIEALRTLADSEHARSAIGAQVLAEAGRR